MGRPPKPNLPKELDTLLHNIGGNIIAFRETKKITQAELSRRARVSVTTLNEIETQRSRDIRLSTLSAIAKVLDISVASLLLGSDIKLGTKDQSTLLKASEAIAQITKKLR